MRSHPQSKLVASGATEFYFVWKLCQINSISDQCGTVMLLYYSSV